ncbi:hypothetical protein ASPWEDRAFT_48314 [Aspergillus wentii DTO 134E9]|uniref:FAD-binding domain-containing protein n=1 Tax=Aspergillus wentii DTO 134E9 TaxID=1073089 RepID=A0A1L9S3W2_ASPWE|nr:uncharacterized protein ASPWEDRAFT_48314 [Aspergillus wentii DTO 134E9]KAI9930161.1 hypothetical protein MW887_011971 [Aspergillus wentii]OJJ41833.1 hypothetical protein ASPWEDRAFT_48314 [Aspergillus wentii DTO 134E9]
MSPVLIVGAGLGGLCLAQALKKHNIPFRVFEKDEATDFRAQGYRIRITQHGYDALESSLSPKILSLFEKTCPEMVIGGGARLDANGNTLSGPGGPPPGIGKAFTVDRGTFRRVLMTGIEEFVSFGMQFERYSLREDGVRAHFQDGSIIDGGLLVGADGVRSRVRKQLIEQFYILDTGMRIVYGKTPLRADLEAALPADCLRGMSLVVDESDARKTLLLEPIRFDRSHQLPFALPENYVYWVLLAHTSAMSIPDDELLRLKNDESADLAVRLTQHWTPALRVLFEQQDRAQTSTLRISSAPPDLPIWESSRVTLLGDAIHAMPPTAGMGANTALRDAADLARRLAAAGEMLDAKVIREYEDDLRSFAKQMIELSWQGGRKSFGLGSVDECERIEL